MMNVSGENTAVVHSDVHEFVRYWTVKEDCSSIQKRLVGRRVVPINGSLIYVL